MRFVFTRMPDGKMSMCVKGVLPLDQERHRTIVEEFYSSNSDLGFPEEVIEYHSWDEVVDNPNLTEKTCVFVDGGITGGPINLGRAILINDGGIIKHSIECGLFHKDGGIIEEEVDIIQTLSHSEK